MNILVKFHQEKTIFDEIRGRILILLFYRPLTRAYIGLLRKKAIKFEVEVLHIPNFTEYVYYDVIKSTHLYVIKSTHLSISKVHHQYDVIKSTIWPIFEVFCNNSQNAHFQSTFLH